MEMDTTKSVTTPVQEVKGELTYDDKVIQKIIGIALENIDGLLTVDGGFFSNIAEKLVNTNNVTSGIDVEVGKKQVAVDLDIVAEYGKDISKLFTDIQKLIVEEVKKMTGLEVIEVNVNVVDIKTKEQYEKDSVTVQDRVGSAAESTGEFASNQTDKAKKAINKGTDKAKEQMEPRVQ
ncbi:Asp23/Gls24 family envelope stress response protein [Enterococcus sp. BWM-S5]|uniref:Stress response regulator gls24 homolog n=2 Tax=Enterococcus larvae TaxID=2794352 RepID=A0ABS4CJC0_9ENTE|nr:Asp23/Gls24 family envelope stress response protein [Enterococcus larvae]